MIKRSEISIISEESSTEVNIFFFFLGFLDGNNLSGFFLGGG
jgi:hypothetical protein